MLLPLLLTLLLDGHPESFVLPRPAAAPGALYNEEERFLALVHSGKCLGKHGALAKSILHATQTRTHTHTVGLRTVKIGTKTAPVCTKSLRLNLFLLLRFKLHLGSWISRITTLLKDAPKIMKIYSNYTKHTTTA